METLSSSKEPTCIFCKIFSGELPGAKVYEDEYVFAFLDINPMAKGHTLVIPKHHAETLLDLPDAYGEALLRALKKIGNALMKTTGATGFNCLQNNFASAGQMVFHIHWHVIPRFDNDKLLTFPSGKYASDDEMKSMADQLFQKTSENMG